MAEYIPRRPVYQATQFDGDVEALQAWIDFYAGVKLAESTGWLDLTVSADGADGFSLRMVYRWGDGPLDYEDWGSIPGKVGDWVTYYNTGFAVHTPAMFNASFEPKTD